MECVLTPRFAVLAVAAAVCDDCEVLSNGERVDAAATPASLDAKARAAYALDGLKTTTSGAEWVGHAAGRGASKTSPWAVWTTGRLLSKEECESWISRGEALTYDTGDYIYKTGKNGYEKAPTGARRHSATRLVEDSAFAESMTKRLFDGVHGVPLKLADGREFRGVRPTFLISKYDAEQYFAPHFDGAMLSPDNTQLSAFTAVLFLNDDFDGGHTHYLPGAGSEVQKPLAMRPQRGAACIHRALSVLHAGGRLVQGTKHIMQFGLMYDAPPAEEIQAHMRPLKWGV